MNHMPVQLSAWIREHPLLAALRGMGILCLCVLVGMVAGAR